MKFREGYYENFCLVTKTIEFSYDCPLFHLLPMQISPSEENLVQTAVKSTLKFTIKLCPF